ncbi:MAG: glycosyltransferase family 2 protein [Sediminibacterium sp.]
MISIIYCTNRLDPKFEWFIESLKNQTTTEERSQMELIFIDSVMERDKPHESANSGSGFSKVIHSKPKPNIYQGAGRKTKTEMFSPSNARNTGILLSSGDYLIFADDVSILMPGWWFAAKQAAEKRMIVCGSYQKHFEMVVENGNLISSRSHQGGIDSRWNGGNNGNPVLIQGSQLFGCSFGIPALDILAVNGFDEVCDSIGGEDYHLGIRLNNIGLRIYYDRRMFTVESEELHNQPFLMLRDDRLLDEGAYNMRLAEFGVKERKAPGRCDSSHMVLDVLYGTHAIWTIGNNFNMTADRVEHYFVPPHNTEKHWFDGKLLSEI